MTGSDLDRRVMAARARFLAMLTEHCPQQPAVKEMLINEFDVAANTMLQAQQDAFVERLDDVERRASRVQEALTKLGVGGHEPPTPTRP